MKFNNKMHAGISGKKYNMMYIRYLNMLKNLAINMFEWSGLPDEIPPVYMEELLFYRGLGAIFYVPEIDMYSFTNVNTSGTIDNYGVGNERYAWNQNYQSFLPKERSIILRDNTSGYPLLDIAMMYADSLANMRLTRDMNIYAQRTPIVVAASNSARLTLSNLAKQYNDFVPFLEISKDAMSGKWDAEVLNLQAPMIFPDLQVEMKTEIASYCNWIGVNAFDSTKKERLLNNETLQNVDMTYINRRSRLQVRERFCEQARRVFGLDLDVKYAGDEILLTPDADIAQDENVSRETFLSDESEGE